MSPLATINIRYEQDVVFCRQRARQIAQLLSFDTQDQTRIATAVSEIARNAFKYAKGGKVEFLIDTKGTPSLQIRISDRGPGIEKLDVIYSGTYRSETGMGLGVLGAKRLMDLFDLKTEAGRGTTVLLGKWLPMPSFMPLDKLVRSVGEKLVKEPPQSPFEEIRRQNQELIQALETVQRQKHALEALNRELEETNRGVVALYAELDEKATSLQRANDLKARFLSNMSHELRTPLNSVLALSQMLLDHLDGALSEEQTRQVGYIKKATEDLYDLVNDLLDIAKIEAGKTVVRVEEFEVREIFSALRGMFRPFANRENVSLVIDEPGEMPAFHSDRGKIAQILRNLLSNALKFTIEGEVRLTAQRGAAGTIALVVKDTGIGIAAEDQERIFEEFTQIEGPMQKQVKGTGLGLPLSQRLVSLLGGVLQLESSPGVGSTFTVVLPLVYHRVETAAETSFTPGPSLHSILHELRAAPADSTILERKLGNVQRSTNAEKILIIDDNEIARYLLNDILASEGYATLEAEDGTRGLRMAREVHPRAIFLDIDMPGMNGYEVLDELRVDPRTRDIPVVINTSELLGEAELKRLTAAAAAIVLKDTSVRKSTTQRIREALGKAGLKRTEQEMSL